MHSTLKNISRVELSQKISEALDDIPSAKAQEILTTLIESMQEGLAKEGVLRIPRFGVFEVQARGRRLGRNPRTREPKVIPAHQTVVFRASPTFRAHIYETNLPSKAKTS